MQNAERVLVALVSATFCWASNSFAAPPSGSVSGPSSGLVSQGLNYSVSASDADGDLSQAELWVTTSALTNPWPYSCPILQTGPWCKFGSSGMTGSSGSFSSSWTPPATGSFLVVTNVYDAAGNRCTGDPNSASGWADCGPSDQLTVTIGNTPSVPSNLRAEWQPSGASIPTSLPILSWDNPTNHPSGIDAVVIRLRKTAPMNGCFQDALIEHWFLAGLPSSSVCQSPATSISTFTAGNPPTVLIASPKHNLQVSALYYWSVWVHQDGRWVSSTGYVEGVGGATDSTQWFRITTPAVTKNIYGVNTYANMQLKDRGLLGYPSAIR